MKELSAESGTLPPTAVLSVVSSQGFSAEETHEMKIALLEVVQSGRWNADTEP